MGVPHRHSDALVAKGLLDAAKVHSRHHKTAGEGVPEIVPVKVWNARRADGRVKPVAGSDQWLTLKVANQGPGAVSALMQLCQGR